MVRCAGTRGILTGVGGTGVGRGSCLRLVLQALAKGAGERQGIGRPGARGLDESQGAVEARGFRGSEVDGQLGFVGAGGEHAVDAQDEALVLVEIFLVEERRNVYVEAAIGGFQQSGAGDLDHADQSQEQRVAGAFESHGAREIMASAGATPSERIEHVGHRVTEGNGVCPPLGNGGQEIFAKGLEFGFGFFGCGDRLLFPDVVLLPFFEDGYGDFSFDQIAGLAEHGQPAIGCRQQRGGECAALDADGVGVGGEGEGRYAGGDQAF